MINYLIIYWCVCCVLVGVRTIQDYPRVYAELYDLGINIREECDYEIDLDVSVKATMVVHIFLGGVVLPKALFIYIKGKLS